jgi:hypothetical protein
VYDLVTKQVDVSRDVIFYEYAQWDWSKSGDHGEIVGEDNTFTVVVEYSTAIQGVPIVEAKPEGLVDHGASTYDFFLFFSCAALYICTCILLPFYFVESAAKS